MAVNPFDLFSTSPAQQAAGAQTNAINTGEQQLGQSFGQGRQALTTNYTAGLQPFIQNYTQATAGTDALADALGMNGPAGSARAVQAFQANPGYAFQVQQAMNGVLANQARSGQLASGNTNIDLAKLVSGMANTGWNQYIANLNPWIQAREAAATGEGNMYAGLGTALNQNWMGQGAAQLQGQEAIGNAQANADLAAYPAASNEWGAILGGAKLAANAFAPKFGSFGTS